MINLYLIKLFGIAVRFLIFIIRWYGIGEFVLSLFIGYVFGKFLDWIIEH